MKYLALEYMKQLNEARYDQIEAHLAKDFVIQNIRTQTTYNDYQTYLKQHQIELEGNDFHLIRCDDFDDIAIVLAEVLSQGQTIYDYIGYFRTNETKIQRINEYWCKRKMD